MLAHLNEEDREEVRFHVDTIEEHEDSSDSWDEETITNSDAFLATDGNYRRLPDLFEANVRKS